MVIISLMNERHKFDISACLKQSNRKYHRNYTVADLAENVGVSRETLTRLTTDSKFSVVYDTAQEIFNLYPEMLDGYFSFREVLLCMCSEDDFFIA